MYAFRCTEQQLNDSLKQIEEAGDTLHSAEFKGGRDWMLFCIKADVSEDQETSLRAAFPSPNLGDARAAEGHRRGRS